MNLRLSRPVRRQQLEDLALTTVLLTLPSLSPELAWLQGLLPLPAWLALAGDDQRRGMLTIAAGAGLAALCTLGAGGSLAMLLFGLLLLPAGALLARAWRLGFSPLAAGGGAAAYLAMLWLGLGALYSASHQLSLQQAILQGLDQSVAASLKLYQQSGRVSAEELKQLTVLLKEFKGLFARLFPAVLLSSIMVTVWLNLVLGRWLLAKRFPGSAGWPGFRCWRLPEQLVWLVVAAGGALLLPLDQLRTLGLNLGLAAGVLYFFQGLANLASLLAKWRMPAVLKGLVYLLVLAQVYGLILLTVVGVADVWFDFRALERSTTGGQT